MRKTHPFTTLPIQRESLVFPPNSFLEPDKHSLDRFLESKNSSTHSCRREKTSEIFRKKPEVLRSVGHLISRETDEFPALRCIKETMHLILRLEGKVSTGQEMVIRIRCVRRFIGSRKKIVFSRYERDVTPIHLFALDEWNPGMLDNRCKDIRIHACRFLVNVDENIIPFIIQHPKQRPHDERVLMDQ